jgi:hypothetical protein
MRERSILPRTRRGFRVDICMVVEGGSARRIVLRIVPPYVCIVNL